MTSSPEAPPIAAYEPHPVCLLVGGPEFKIRVDGHTYLFEYPEHYGGPAALGRRGQILLSQPLEFIRAADLWHQQGRRITQDGFCIWTSPPVCVMKHISGRHYKWLCDEAQPDQS